MASIRVSKIEQDQMHSAHRNKAALVAFEHQADQWMSILGFHPEKNGRSNIRRFWMSFPPSNSMALHRVSIPTGFFFLFFFFFALLLLRSASNVFFSPPKKKAPFLSSPLPMQKR